MFNQELICSIFMRPRMFCADVATFRDVLLLAQGACHGLRPPHGSEALPGFSEFLAHKFGEATVPWPQRLQSRFGHLSLQQACEATCELLAAWEAEQAE